MHSSKPTAPFAGWLCNTNEVTRAFLSADQIPGLINIAGGLPEPSLYPSDEMAALAERVIREHPKETLGYGPIEGLPELREVVARRFSNAQCQLSTDNVLITTSGMQGLDLLGKALLDKGDLVAGQFPTYLGALDAWRPRQPRFVNMEVAAEGFDPVNDMVGAKFAYTVPNFSNPTGRLVSEEIRYKLVEASHATGAWLVEDDPYGSLSYDGPLPPGLLDIDMQAGGVSHVVYLGTMSKLIAPGLRVGWAIASPTLIEAMTMAKQGSDMCTSGITQRLTCEILKSDLIERNQPKVVNLYRARRNALCNAMAEHLSDWFDWETPAGGMFVWAKAKDPRLNTDRLFRIGLEEKVCISPSSVFDAHDAYRQGVRLNFTLNDEDTLAEGVRRLAGAVERLLADNR